jgi:hypothetical protein
MGMPNVDVEKVSSAHRAVNQLEYQVEVPQLAQSGDSFILLRCPKPDSR